MSVSIPNPAIDEEEGDVSKGVADSAVDGDIIVEPTALDERKSEGETTAPGDRLPCLAAPLPFPPPANADRKENTVFF